jgi:membrane protein implicated in regulation of membrane protease activity
MRRLYFASRAFTWAAVLNVPQNVACNLQTSPERTKIMEQSIMWWVAAGILVAVELATGTFYLLMLAVGMAAGAVAAHLGASSIVQASAAAVVGGGAVVLQYLRGKNQPKAEQADSNRNVHIDIGETVMVDQWGADGTTTVKYRGALWTAVTAVPGEHTGSGQFRIRQLLGNRLVIEKV